MILKHIFPNNMVKVQNVCEEILGVRRKKFYHKYSEDPEWIRDHCYGGIKKETFQRLINNSLHNKNTGELLEAIVEVVDAKSITNIIFQQLYHYPVNCARKSFWISLSHKKGMTESQLKDLCATNYTFECFFELAKLYYKNKGYSVETFSCFLDNFRKGLYSDMYDDMLQELKQTKTKDKEKRVSLLLEISKRKQKFKK